MKEEFRNWAKEILKKCPMCNQEFGPSKISTPHYKCDCDTCSALILDYNNYIMISYNYHRFYITTNWTWAKYNAHYSKGDPIKIPKSLLNWDPTPSNIKAFVDSNIMSTYYYKYLLLAK